MFCNRVTKNFFAPSQHVVKLEDKLSWRIVQEFRHNIVLSLDNMKLDNEEMMAWEVADFKASGGHSIVEVSAPGIRSSPDDLMAIRQISKSTGVHIVASTGLYAEDTWPCRYRIMEFKQYVSFLHREIAQGVGDTGILPGHIKAAYEVFTHQLRRLICVRQLVLPERQVYRYRFTRSRRHRR